MKSHQTSTVLLLLGTLTRLAGAGTIKPRLEFGMLNIDVTSPGAESVPIARGRYEVVG